MRLGLLLLILSRLLLLCYGGNNNSGYNNNIQNIGGSRRRLFTSGEVIDVGDPSVYERFAGEILDLRTALANEIKTQFIAQTGRYPERFELTAYTSENVGGRNYFCKVKIGRNQYAHLRIYKPLPSEHKPMELAAVLLHKAIDDPIRYFERFVQVARQTTPRWLQTTSAQIPSSKLTRLVNLSNPSPDDAVDIAELMEVLGTLILQYTMLTKQRCLPERFDLISYAKQYGSPGVVFAKVQISDSDYVHLRIFRPNLQSKYQLDAIQPDKNSSDPLQFFERDNFARIVAKQSNNNRGANKLTRWVRFPGGLTEIVQVDSSRYDEDDGEIQQLRVALVKTIKDQFSQKIGSVPSIFDLVAFASYNNQNGTTFFAKIKTSNGEAGYAHLRIFEPKKIPMESMNLIAVQVGKTFDDPIEFFKKEEEILSPRERSVDISRRSTHQNVESSGQLDELIEVNDPEIAVARWDEIEELKAALSVASLKEEFVKKAGFRPRHFELISFAVGVDDHDGRGVDYFAKVRTGPDDKCAHVRLFKQTGKQQMELVGLQSGHFFDDPLEYFVCPPPATVRTTTQRTTTRLTTTTTKRPAIVRRTTPQTTTIQIEETYMGEVVELSDHCAVTANSEEVAELEEALSIVIKPVFILETNQCPTERFELVSYAKEPATNGGTIYVVKVRLSTSEYVHLRICKPPEYGKPMILTAILMGKTLEDPVNYFENGNVAMTAFSKRVTTTPPRRVTTRRRPPNDSYPPETLSEVVCTDDQNLSQETLDDIYELQSALSTFLRDQFVKKVGYWPAQFELVSFAKEASESGNYFAKVRIGPDEEDYVHLRIFKPNNYLDPPMQLVAVQSQKTLEDPITFIKGNVVGLTTTTESTTTTKTTTIRTTTRRRITTTRRTTTTTTALKTSGILEDVIEADNSEKEEDIAELSEALSSNLLNEFIRFVGYKPQEFELVRYAVQEIRGGSNVFAKVRIDATEGYAHLRIFKPSNFNEGRKMDLIAVQTGKTLQDPMEIFDEDDIIPNTTIRKTSKTTTTKALRTTSPRKWLEIVIRVDDPGLTVEQEQEISDLRLALKSCLKNQFFRQNGGNEPSQFELVSFAVQKGPMGTETYYVKVQTNYDEFVHLRILKSAPVNPCNTLELTSFQSGKSADDPLNIFEERKNEVDYNAIIFTFPPVIATTRRRLTTTTTTTTRSAPVKRRTTTIIMTTRVPNAQQLGRVISLSDAAAFSENANEIAQLKAALRSHLRAEYVLLINQRCMPDKFELISYAKQNGSGGVYIFAKIQMTLSDYVHLRIFKPFFPQQLMRVEGVQRGKTWYDPIRFFQQQAPMPVEDEPLPAPNFNNYEGYDYGSVETTTMILKPYQASSGQIVVIQVNDPELKFQNSAEIAQLKIALQGGLKDKFLQKMAYRPSMFELISYAKQIPAGSVVKYVAKVKIAPNEYVHLRINKPSNFPRQPMELVAVQTGKRQSDWLDFFEDGRPVPPIMRTNRPTTTTTTRQPDYGGDYNSLSMEDIGSVILLEDPIAASENADEIKQLKTALKGLIKAQYVAMANINCLPDRFTLTSYAKQSVPSGPINYFAKVQIDNNNNYVHLRILKPSIISDDTLQLSAVQLGKTLRDPIVYFENVKTSNNNNNNNNKREQEIDFTNDNEFTVEYDD